VKCIQGSRPAEAFAPIDGKKLAQELKAERDYVSRHRKLPGGIGSWIK